MGYKGRCGAITTSNELGLKKVLRLSDRLLFICECPEFGIGSILWLLDELSILSLGSIVAGEGHHRISFAYAHSPYGFQNEEACALWAQENGTIPVGARIAWLQHLLRDN